MYNIITNENLLDSSRNSIQCSMGRAKFNAKWEGNPKKR